MAVTAKYYGLFWKSVCNKEVDVDSDTWKIALFTSALTIDQDAHQYFDVAPYLTNQVANGNGYTTGGITISPLTVTYTGATNKLSISSAINPSWTSSTFTARYGIIYDSTPGTNKPLLGYVDFGADQSPSNGTLSLTWDVNGICYVTVA